MIGLVLINSGYRSNLLFSFAHVLELRWGISLSGPECVATSCDDLETYYKGRNSKQKFKPDEPVSKLDTLIYKTIAVHVCLLQRQYISCTQLESGIILGTL